MHARAHATKPRAGCGQRAGTCRVKGAPWPAQANTHAGARTGRSAQHSLHVLFGDAGEQDDQTSRRLVPVQRDVAKARVESGAGLRPGQGGGVAPAAPAMLPAGERPVAVHGRPERRRPPPWWRMKEEAVGGRRGRGTGIPMGRRWDRGAWRRRGRSAWLRRGRASAGWAAGRPAVRVLLLSHRGRRGPAVVVVVVEVAVEAPGPLAGWGWRALWWGSSMRPAALPILRLLLVSRGPAAVAPPAGPCSKRRVGPKARVPEPVVARREHVKRRHRPFCKELAVIQKKFQSKQNRAKQ